MVEAYCGLSYGSRIEVCGFKCKCCGILNDLGVKTAHDACNCYRSVAVANHKCIFVDMTLNIIKSYKVKGLVEALYSYLFNLS